MFWTERYGWCFDLLVNYDGLVSLAEETGMLGLAFGELGHFWSHLFFFLSSHMMYTLDNRKDKICDIVKHFYNIFNYSMVFFLMHSICRA